MLREAHECDGLWDVHMCIRPEHAWVHAQGRHTCSMHSSAVLPRQVMAAERLSGFLSSATMVFTAPAMPISPLLTSAANASACSRRPFRVWVQGLNASKTTGVGAHMSARVCQHAMCCMVAGGFVTRAAACELMRLHCAAE
jgi:hypothetical protein